MEIIGLLITMFLLVAAAFVVGSTCAGVVGLLLKTHNLPWRKASLIASLFPPSATAYILACAILSSVVSSFLGTPDFAFGDINQELPNGYTIEALGKMPECGHIQKAGNSLIQVAWVSSLQVHGPNILGKYDYTYFPRTPTEAARNYFSLDTRTGDIVNFASETELENYTKAKVHLTPTPDFRGAQTIQKRFATTVLFLIAVFPPLVTGLWLIYRLVLLLRSGREPRLTSNF